MLSAAVIPKTPTPTGDGQLLESDQRTSDTRRSELGVEHGHEHRQCTDTETRHESTGVNASDIRVGGSLGDGANHENHTPARDRVLSRILVRSPASDEGTKERAKLKNGGEKTFGV